MWKSHSEACEILGPDRTLYQSMELSLEELEKDDPIAASILALFSFLDHNDLWYEICHNATGNTFPPWLQDLAKNKTPFKCYYPLLADLSFIEPKIYPNGSRIWEIHPAIQAVAKQRAKTKEQEYIRCVISLVAAQVPRSSMTNACATMRRLLPHVQLCWRYIKGGKWGPSTNLTDLESLARVFRQVGHYDEASVIYQMIARGLSFLDLTLDNLEFRADVLTNLGLVYTYQRKFEQALSAFDESSYFLSELGKLSPNASMSIAYNKAVVFMMTDRLDEAEEFLHNAAVHFSEDATDEYILDQDERKSLYLRILNDMGEVFLRKGEVVEAFRLFQDVLYYGQIYWQGEQHPAQVSLNLNIGRTLTKLGNFPGARDLLLEVISIYTDWWGRRHPETIRAIDELAWAFMNEAKYKQARGENSESEMRSAEELWNEALTFYRCADTDGSDTVARLEANLTYLYS
jgi:tetratricopeptide (TPR) repeat protein